MTLIPSLHPLWGGVVDPCDPWDQWKIKQSDAEEMISS